MANFVLKLPAEAAKVDKFPDRLFSHAKPVISPNGSRWYRCKLLMEKFGSRLLIYAINWNFVTRNFVLSFFFGSL